MNVSAPCVDFSSRAAARVKWKLFLNVVTAVESEAVAFAVGRALQLLKQEDDSIMDDAEHPRAAHHTQRKLLQVEACPSFKDALNHGAPGN